MSNRPEQRPSVVAGLLGAWPGLVLGAGTLLFRREYFFVTYAIVSGFFWVLTFALGALTPRHLKPGRSRKQVFLLAFRDLALAWGGALVLLSILNLTPLCIGRDNGDGRNTVALGIIQSAAVAVCYTPPVLGMVALAALGLGRWLKHISESRL
jgi:hypothetical protein